ncbi:MAG: hypothetical protein HZY75_11900 [Nocardioidaceae bacterium]|nr:MAG: hypothetical protein HZY75_11900 [Nocardioidaceae bacterium]
MLKSENASTLKQKISELGSDMGDTANEIAERLNIKHQKKRAVPLSVYAGALAGVVGAVAVLLWWRRRR